ncbi:hypothetical protein MHK_007238 [Candidatus Magnetomorum sp. HK-1]|nr:hypothetical protein MHK_007238 [Candidatus Magnetomorum sp. HK-1]
MSVLASERKKISVKNNDIEVLILRMTILSTTIINNI